MTDPTTTSDATSGPTAPRGLQCPSCKHVAAVGGDPSKETLCCGECGTRIAYGTAIPRVVVQPDAADRRFVLFQATGIGTDGKEVSLTLKFDRAYARLVGTNLGSM